jgi:uncharacterized protein
VIAVALALAVGSVALALTLRPNAGIDTFVGRSSASYRETERYYRSFGEEPVQVLVKGSLQQLLLSSDIDKLLGLEGCLSGKVPTPALAEEGGIDGPCGALDRAKAVRVVLGPGTFINEAAIEIESQLAHGRAQAEAQGRQARLVVARAALARGRSAAEADALGEQARKATLTGYAAEVTALALRYGINSVPSLEDPNFVSTLVFGNTTPAGTPKPRFAYLFPSRNAALVSVRLRAGLSAGQRSQAIALIRRAAAMPEWHLRHGETYLVTGEPVLVSDLTGSIAHSAELLLIAVVLVMAAMLGLVFQGRPRLLPLAVALLATALTFGALAISGATLTLAQVAVLPVLIGLAVDYAIQLQSRIGEALDEDLADPAAAVGRAARLGAPSIAVAASASAGALLVLALSPVPTVTGFGLLLVLGIVCAFLCALTVGSAAMALAEGRGQGPRGGWARLADSTVGAAWRGAGELVRENPITRAVPELALGGAVRKPVLVLAVGLALAALGWGLSTQTPVQTDITKLAPQSLASLHGLETLEHEAGVGGEIDLMVSGDDLTRPAVIEWMSSYEAAMLKRFGYSASRGCGRATLCPAFSLTDLFAGEAGSEGTGSSSGPLKLSSKQVRALLGAIPAYFSEDVISANRHEATLAFGIRLMPLDEQQSVIETMVARLHPPAGVQARLVGLAVLAAQADAQVGSVWRRTAMWLVGLAVVALILLLAFGMDLRRALVPLVPVLLATGWSSLVLFAVGVALNPLSVTLGVMVVAISTEFSVLLAERHRQERLAGHHALQALRRSFSKTGAAVSASAVTAIAGFAVLTLSDVNMLRDFGLVTVIDLSVSLAGVLIVLPPTLMLAERGISALRPLGTPVHASAARGPLAWLRRRGQARHEPV